MHHQRGIGDLRGPRAAFARASALRRDRLQHTIIERAVHAERVVETVTSRQKRRELRVEFADRERDVRAELLHRAFDAGARPIPHFALGITRSHEEHHRMFGMFRQQHEDALGLVESGEVEHVAVGAEVVFDVVVAHRDGGRRNDRTRVRAHGFEKLRSSLLEHRGEA